MRFISLPVLTLALTVPGLSCDQPTVASEDLIILAVVPADGAVGVDPAAPLSIRFSHPMRTSMVEYAALHRGSPSGPVVRGRWEWSPDFTVMTFHPDHALEHQTAHFLHIGGGLQDMRGRHLDYEHALQHFGGEWCTEDHLGGMMSQHMMGPGWRHRNGTYGMVWSFTTA